MAVMKSEPDGEHPASHYLVVEDATAPSTWHLRFKDAAGTADHRLMGACWAALTVGYRGNKYQGPNKAEAMTKLKALYKSEGMETPAMMTAATFSDDMVVRVGKVFEIGDYPDKDFEFTDDDLQAAVANFEPVPVDLEHVPTVLEGKLGTVQRIYAGDDGASLMGEVHLPAWLDRVLADGERKVSATWDRASKRLLGLALVRNPRVSDAALMAAFSATTTHSTPKEEGRRMNLRDWITGKAKDEGVSLDDLDVAFSQPDVTALEQQIAAKDAEISRITTEQERQAALFVQQVEEKRQAQAATFATQAVQAHRIPPAAAPILAQLAARVAAADSAVTFAEGEKSAVALLQEFVESLPDYAIFTTPQIPNGGAAALFTQAKTQSDDLAQDELDKLLAMTPAGQRALAARNGNGGK